MSGQMKWHRAKLQGLPTRSLQDEHEHRSKDAAARWLAKQDVKTARWWRGIIHFTHLAREGGHMPVTIGRRKLMAVLGGAAATWPLAARAQRGERKPASASATAQNDRTSLVIRPGVECAATAWNHQRLAPNAPIDPASASIVSFLVAQMRASATMIYCAPDQPLYVVDPSTPTVRVKVVDSDTNPQAAWLQQFFNAVPM